MKRAVIIIAIIVPIVLLWFAYATRQGELLIVRATSDFYMSLLTRESSSVSVTRSMATNSFLDALAQASSSAVMCGLSFPEQVRVGSASSFFDSGTVTVVLVEGTKQEVATVSLVRKGGVWLVDGVQCKNGQAVLAGEIERETYSTVSIFVYDARRDSDAAGNVQCSSRGVVPVTRRVGVFDGTVMERAVRLLLSSGVLVEESSSGLSSEFPLEGVELVSITVSDGVAYVRIDDPLLKLSGGSCRVNILRSQVEQTVLQFSDIERVVFEPAELFQP